MAPFVRSARVNNWHSTERRRHARKACFVTVDYAIRDRLYKDFLQNISAGGALIGTHRPIYVGEDVSMTFQMPDSLKPVNITGKVMWASPLGIGVKFRLGQLNFTAPKVKVPDSNVLENEQEKSIPIEKEVKEVGRVKKKRIRWQPSLSLDVIEYRLYWSKYGEIGYNSDHVQLGNVTEVTLPDDVPSFPLETGDMELGVTAVNQAGNESEIAKVSAYFNFAVPDAPLNLEVEDM